MLNERENSILFESNFYLNCSAANGDSTQDVLISNLLTTLIVFCVFFFQAKCNSHDLQL